jgi:endonuclease YncB( thermonuclease family)
MAAPARTKRFQALLGYVLVVLACSGPALAATPSSSYTPFTATGTVVSNHDGDTFKLQTPDRDILTIRFSGIDTPETGQAFWKSARRSLAGLVRGQPVTVRCYKKSHERDVCRVFAGTASLDVGLEIVRLGMAWHAFQFAHEQTEDERVAYKTAEEQARLGRVGLWSEPDPMAPWECRRLRRAGQKCR